MGILKSASARYVVHTLIAFMAVFFPLWQAANFTLEKSAVYGIIGAAARALLGATTSTNPQIGKNYL
jgi:hypothetical protein